MGTVLWLHFIPEKSLGNAYPPQGGHPESHLSGSSSSKQERPFSEYKLWKDTGINPYSLSLPIPRELLAQLYLLPEMFDYAPLGDSIIFSVIIQ